MGLKITKEEMRKMPTETFDGEIIVIDKVEDAIIYSDVLGSDHCPIGITLK